jgi:hypothetical protein
MKAGGETFGVGGLSAEELGVINLHLADFVRVSGRDATTRGTAGLLAKRMDAVVFPGEVEDAVGDVADHAALIDE